jgi:ATP phosphoribosyltransferase
MDLMRASGVQLPNDFRACRITVHRVPEHCLDVFILRGEDLPSLLASRHLDAAVGSSIVFDEHDVDRACRVGAVLDIGDCRLSLIERHDARFAREMETGGRLLCTRYPRTAARLLAEYGDGAWDIHALSGCVETALFLGLSDAIVDIVETGWTLQALALREQRILCTVRHQIRLRSEGSELLSRLRALMPQVAWRSDSGRGSDLHTSDRTIFE